MSDTIILRRPATDNLHGRNLRTSGSIDERVEALVDQTIREFGDELARAPIDEAGFFVFTEKTEPTWLVPGTTARVVDLPIVDPDPNAEDYWNEPPTACVLVYVSLVADHGFGSIYRYRWLPKTVLRGAPRWN